MKAIRVRKRLDSQILDLPEVAGVVGQTVDIIIIIEETESPPRLPNFAALDAIAGHDLIDEDAILELRRISTL